MKFRIFNLAVLFFSMILFFNADVKGIKITDKKGNEGVRWAVCVGINDYWDDKITDLKKARNDAEAIGAILEKQGQFNKVFIMNDALDAKDKNYPSKFNIEANINYIAEMAGVNDLVLFHFSGHGIADKSGESYLLTADTRYENLFDSSVKLDYIVNKIKSKGVKKILLMIDACREELTQSKGVAGNNFNAGIYSESDLAAVFYATKQGWFSYEDPKSDYGIFSRFAAEGLYGKADSNIDGIVSFTELEQYVSKEIFNYAVSMGYKQMPYTKIYGEKFGDLALTVSRDKGSFMTDKFEKDGPQVSENFVLVKGGPFRSNKSNYFGKNVTISDFYIGKYEVSAGEFKQFIDETNYKTTADINGGSYIDNAKYTDFMKGANWKNPQYIQDDKFPVVLVSWYDAVEYCNWRSSKEGLTRCYKIDKSSRDPNNTGAEDIMKWSVIFNEKADGYRLPTEAEWEYAASGGADSKSYSYSGSETPSDVSWSREIIRDQGSRPCGALRPNELGIFDMSGNVWEWCWDWYGTLSYKTSEWDALDAS